MKGIGKKYADVIMNIVMTSASFIEVNGMDSLNKQEGGKKWNRRQILGHLIDSSYHNQLRIIKRLDKNTMDFEGYDQDLCVDLNQYELRSNTEVLETFIVFQRQIANLISGISDEAYLKNYKLPVNANGKFPNLSSFVHDYILHMEHHLGQIIDGYTALGPKQYYR